jgi:hypothetical protein
VKPRTRGTTVFINEKKIVVEKGKVYLCKSKK